MKKIAVTKVFVPFLALLMFFGVTVFADAAYIVNHSSSGCSVQGVDEDGNNVGDPMSGTNVTVVGPDGSLSAGCQVGKTVYQGAGVIFHHWNDISNAFQAAYPDSKTY
jgi:hypothetical protein